jgi:hypothetical protein
MAHRDYGPRGRRGRRLACRPAPGERTPPLVSPPIPRARPLCRARAAFPLPAVLFPATIGDNRFAMRTLLLGLGNPLLGDDAVGLKVAALVRARLDGSAGVDVVEEEAGGLPPPRRAVPGHDRR